MGQSLQQQAKELFKLTEELKIDCKETNIRFFEIARKLYQIKQQRLYRYFDASQLGTDYCSFQRWLAQSDIPIRDRTARRWIYVYTKFIKQLGFKAEEVADIEYSKLELIAPYLPENSRDLATGGQNYITKARSLSRRDLEISLFQEGKQLDACGHEEIEEMLSFRCKNCHERFWHNPLLKDIKRDELSEQIDALLHNFREKTGLSEMSESYKESRKWASNLLKKYEWDEILACVDWLLEDEFWKNTLSKIRQLYYQMPRYLKAPSESKAEWVSVKK